MSVTYPAGTPPATPQEYIEMVAKHHRDTRVQRLEHTKETCPKPCNRDIPVTEYTNMLENQTCVHDPLRKDSHNALKLCDEVEAIMSDGPQCGTDDQLRAIDEFKEITADHTESSLLQKLGSSDASNVSKCDMKLLIQLLLRIFFRDNQIAGELNFDWLPWKKPYYLGLYTDRGWDGPKIELSASHFSTCVPEHGHVNGRAMARLGALLHEIVHAYLDFYSCRCPSYSKDVDAFEGHGRAWQRIARAVEHAAPRFIDLPLKLDRFDAITTSWDVPLYWPTQKEVIDWNLDE